MTHYFGRCGIVIRKNTDLIVFENPGSIRVGKEQMLQGGISDTRNKTIMKMFNLLGYGEKAGSGIPLIMQASKEFGLPKPQVDENSELDRTLFTLFVNSNERSNEESTGDNARNVIDNAENAVDNAENVVDNAENAVDNAENAVDNAENAVRGKCYSKNKIYDCLKLKGPCSSKYLAECIGLSVRRTQELLLEMIKEDIILAIGVHPEKKYMIKKDI